MPLFSSGLKVSEEALMLLELCKSQCKTGQGLSVDRLEQSTLEYRCTARGWKSFKSFEDIKSKVDMQSHRSSTFRQSRRSLVMLDLCSLFTRIIQSEVFTGMGQGSPPEVDFKCLSFPQ